MDGVGVVDMREGARGWRPHRRISARRGGKRRPRPDDQVGRRRVAPGDVVWEGAPHVRAWREGGDAGSDQVLDACLNVRVATVCGPSGAKGAVLRAEV